MVRRGNIEGGVWRGVERKFGRRKGEEEQRNSEHRLDSHGIMIGEPFHCLDESKDRLGKRGRWMNKGKDCLA